MLPWTALDKRDVLAFETTLTEALLSCREGVGPETGNKVFDPLGLAKIASPETLAWYRAAELKHSRVAMVRSAIDALDISA
eukprot:scaffold264660_cov37-Tisochrysis_lutea.AAC.1